MRTRELPLPTELWDRIPPDIQAALQVVIAGYKQRIATLETELATLKTRVNQSSQDSSRPPSSDGPGVKRRPPPEPSGRKRGGQPGHPPHRRALVPLEQVQVVVPCVPPPCRRCGEALPGSAPTPLRPQVTEIPEPIPHVTEYQLHRLPCPRCGGTTCGSLPPGVPAVSYGPRLASLVALCRGADRMSKRMGATFCTDVVGVPLALGEVGQVAEWVTTAREPPVQDARAYVQTQPVNGDETTWREQRQRAYLWVAVTQWVSVFLIRTSRGASVLWELLGEGYRAVLTSDRAKAYNGHPLQKRQLCWAHLQRDFQAMVDRGGPAGEVGRLLLMHAEVVFGWWHWVREGHWRRTTFQRRLPWLRRSLRGAVEQGTWSPCAQTEATCRELPRVEPALWTFVRVAGVEPTNNAAARALRHAVQGRKTSYGTDSAGGSRFVENILTVVMSCRQQKRNVWAYLTACCQARYTGTPPPSLLPQPVR